MFTAILKLKNNILNPFYYCHLRDVLIDLCDSVEKYAAFNNYVSSSNKIMQYINTAPGFVTVNFVASITENDTLYILSKWNSSEEFNNFLLQSTNNLLVEEHKIARQNFCDCFGFVLTKLGSTTSNVTSGDDVDNLIKMGLLNEYGNTPFL